MKNIKSHFWYNNSQRNGILFLVLIIIILQLLYFFSPFSSKSKTTKNAIELLEFQQEIDSLKQIAVAQQKPKIFPFNPSFITDYKGYQLGMTPQEIDRLLKYRANGNYINSAKEFQHITQISDSLLKAISPYFKFPAWLTNKKRNLIQNSYTSKNESQKKETLTSHRKKDLNLVSAKDLQAINGVGDKLSKRIVSYRKKLGGYAINEQLYEVWGLKKEIANQVLQHFSVLKKPTIQKININTATFKEVLSIVYIDYKLTKKIFNYRDEVAEIQSLDSLKKIDGFPLEKFDRIALYLEAK